MDMYVKPLVLNISRNNIFIGLSVLGLGLFTYVTNKYLNNVNQTTNQYYINTTSDNSVVPPNLTLTTLQGHKNIIYIFWNGDMNSTYLLIDLLLQDKIIQPLYIEKYTILKKLEYDNLEKMVTQYNNYHKNDKNDKNFIKIKSYLQDVARIKNIQTYESTQLELFRNLIIKEYPEFQRNLLSTLYITTITKDLEHTTQFFNTINTISPVHYNGIEFIEQITRFLKHYKPIHQLEKNDTNISHNTCRILIGYSKQHKNINLIQKILKNNSKNYNTLHIEMPLSTINENDIKYLAYELCPNNITKFFKKT